MADPTSDQIAKLVGEISGLKKALDAAIDHEEIDPQFETATSGLLKPDGQFDSAAWEALGAAEKTAREATLTKLNQTLANAAASTEPTIPIAPESFMYKKHASNDAILWLTAFALFGILADLLFIHAHWTEATSGKVVAEASANPNASSPSATPQASRTTTPLASARTRTPDGITPTPTPSSTPAVLAQGETPTPTASATTGTTTTTTAAATPPPAPGAPTEESVLLMVMLLGALGGFLRLASSMANYVGNRQLLKSWIIYYILTPVQGAALAPVVYLLLRVGVLNPANTQPGTSSPTASLNLIGIYAFAALTGLFSKQAIEMLADVFSTIFKRADTKDSLKQDKDKAKDKGPKTAAP